MKQILILRLLFSLLFLSACNINQDKNQVIYDVEEMQQLVDKEIDSLHQQLEEAIELEGYTVIDGSQKELHPETILDFNNLINLLEKNQKNFYYFNLLTYMSESGYETDGQTYEENIKIFFDEEYEKQSLILGKIFWKVKSHEYKVATEYEYTVEEEKISAQVTEIENRAIPIIILRAFSIDEKNENTIVEGEETKLFAK